MNGGGAKEEAATVSRSRSRDAALSVLVEAEVEGTAGSFPPAAAAAEEIGAEDKGADPPNPCTMLLLADGHVFLVCPDCLQMPQLRAADFFSPLPPMVEPSACPADSLSPDPAEAAAAAAALEVDKAEEDAEEEGKAALPTPFT